MQSMTKIPVITRMPLAALLFVLSSCSAQSPTPSERASETDGLSKPNFIVILADDLRLDLLGYTGHPIIKTPNIDGLAKKGVVFKNAFATSPVCTPSRTSLLTGMYERKHAVNFLSGNVLPEDIYVRSYPEQHNSRWL